MLRFIVRRLLQLIPILLGLSILLFAWLRALPGGPAQAALGERATPEAIARYNELFGLDQPSDRAVPALPRPGAHGSTSATPRAPAAR